MNRKQSFNLLAELTKAPVAVGYIGPSSASIESMKQVLETIHDLLDVEPDRLVSEIEGGLSLYFFGVDGRSVSFTCDNNGEIVILASTQSLPAASPPAPTIEVFDAKKNGLIAYAEHALIFLKTGIPIPEPAG